MTNPDDHSTTQNLLAIGTVIADRYKLLQKIGEGGAGTVYKAHDNLLDRTVAVKTINRSSLSDDEAVRFHREAKVAASITHPNVIKMLDFGILDSGQPYMVMEYVNGISLFRFLKEHGYQSPDFALYLMKQICRGMAAVHSTGIVHRDLKASNIMVIDLSENPQVVIIDFGIAKSLDTEGQFQTLTHVGNVVGTPRYMSPEQAMGKKLDQRSDIYSMGCILFELLTNRALFEGATGIDTINKHVAERPPSLADAQSDTDYPVELETLVSKMVAKDPDDRYQNTDELKTAIDEVYSVARGTTDNLDEEGAPRERNVPSQTRNVGDKNSHTFAFAVIFGVLLCVGVVVVALNWKLIDSGPTPAEVHKSEKIDLMIVNSELAKKFEWTGEGVSKALRAYCKKNKSALGVVVTNSTLTQRDIERILSLGTTFIALERCKLDDPTKAIETLAQSKTVHTIGFDFVDGISPQSLKPLRNTRHLSTLSLQGCNLTDEHMKEIGVNHLYLLVVTENPSVSPKCLPAFAGRPTDWPALSMLVHGTEIAKLSEAKLRALAPKYNIVFSKEPYGGTLAASASESSDTSESLGSFSGLTHSDKPPSLEVPSFSETPGVSD
jgi:Serine/threonine protein kinase